MNKTFLAGTTIIGTILGAGIFGIPYVIMKSGFFLGIIHLILIGAIMTLLMLYLGEISLRTRTTHQLPGYAEKYLGKKGKKLMFLISAFGMFSALIAYLVAEGESFSNIIFNSNEYAVYFSLLFWLALSFITYFGIKALEEGESIGVSIILVMVFSLLFFFYSKINHNNLTYINYENAFLPFGIILFAFLAFSAIPEIRIIIKNKEKGMKKSIIFAYLICLILYVIFTLIVLGLKGSSTPEIATFALGKPFIILGILTIFTAYLGISFALIDTFRYDFYFTRKKSWLLTISITLFLFIIFSIFGIAKFSIILGLSGTISGGLTAILILFMIKKAKSSGNRKPEYSIPYSPFLAWILILIFALGAIFEIISLF